MKGREGRNGRIGASTQRRSTGVLTVVVVAVVVVVVVVVYCWRDEGQTKSIHGFLRRPVQIQDLPTANETESICSLGGSVAGIKANNLIGKNGKLFIEFGAEPIELP